MPHKQLFIARISQVLLSKICDNHSTVDELSIIFIFKFFGSAGSISDLFLFHSKLKKLSEDSLTKQPEEVFDVLEKLGEG